MPQDVIDQHRQMPITISRVLPTPPGRGMRKNAKVRITNLSCAPEFNGLTGHVVSFDDSTELWTIVLEELQPRYVNVLPCDVEVLN